MSRAQSRSYESLGSRFIVPADGGITGCFENQNPPTVEIGFGMGHATAEIAAAHPEKNYLGIEVFRAGIGKLLWEIEKRNLTNVRIVEHDAVFVLEKMMKQQSAEAFHVFFPDPWPKKKHHKRRLIRRPFTDLLASRLVPGGYVYVVTDWEEYAEFALGELSATNGLENPCGTFAPRLEWRPPTKFEKKGLDKNHRVRELYFVKKA
jgi:tRNA (guanine-N7-)-methyltransferase